MLNRISVRRRRSMDVRSRRDRSTVRFGPECVRLSGVSKTDGWSRHGYPGGWRQRCFEARVERVPSGHSGHLRNGYRRSLLAAFVVNGVSITLMLDWRASSVRSEPDAGVKHGMCKAGCPKGCPTQADHACTFGARVQIAMRRMLSPSSQRPRGRTFPYAGGYSGSALRMGVRRRS